MHTPGPWSYHFGAGLVTAREDGSIPLNTRVVAKITEAGKSDLRLIAAAPSMYELLARIYVEDGAALRSDTCASVLAMLAQVQGKDNE